MLYVFKTSNWRDYPSVVGHWTIWHDLRWLKLFPKWKNSLCNNPFVIWAWQSCSCCGYALDNVFILTKGFTFEVGPWRVKSVFGSWVSKIDTFVTLTIVFSTCRHFNGHIWSNLDNLLSREACKSKKNCKTGLLG